VPLDEPASGGHNGTGSSNSPGRYEDQEPASPKGSKGSKGSKGDEESKGSKGSKGTERPAHRPSGTPEPAGTPSESAAPPTSAVPSASSAPPAPAKLTVSDPEREPTDQRWCEKVTLVFHNVGGTAIRSGTVTFGTHVIGALGVDWATVESTGELPAPLDAGARKERTWTVCVEEWHVPLGMHIETRDIEVRWK
jgi:hypothetical protein